MRVCWHFEARRTTRHDPNDVAPKRNAAGSSPVWGAKSTAASPFLGLAAFLCAFFSLIRPENFYALQAVFLLIGFEHFSSFLLRKMPFC